MLPVKDNTGRFCFQFGSWQGGISHPAKPGPELLAPGCPDSAYS